MNIAVVRAIRAEMTKSFIGLWMIPAYVVAAMIPWVLATNLPAGGISGDVDDAVYEIAAVAALGSAFVGTWVVTRDYYYRSLSRAVVVSGRAAVFIAKMVTAVAVGAIASSVALLAWLPFGAAVLAGEGAQLRGNDVAARVAGMVVVGALAGLFGASIAWLVPNYFGASIVAIALPLVAEIAPAIAAGRAVPGLPTSAAASLSGITLTGALSPAVNLVVILAWVAVFVAAGWVAFRRREL